MYLSSLIILYHYIDECYEGEFISAVGDAGLTFFFVKCLLLNNISQLRFLLRILRHKVGVILFEPETKMTDLCGEIIATQFGQTKNFHEVGSKPELILC